MQLQAIKQAEEHIDLVKQERAHYHSCCQTSTTNLQDCFADVPSPGSYIPPRSHDITIHYSFDMAQQVCHNHRQQVFIYFSKDPLSS